MMTRKTGPVALRRLALLACALTATPAIAQKGAAPIAAAAPAQAQRPNILFVLIDDMGFADLSIMGDRKITTPNLDKLAKDGVLLTKFYDAAPIATMRSLPYRKLASKGVEASTLITAT